MSGTRFSLNLKLPNLNMNIAKANLRRIERALNTTYVIYLRT